MRLDGYTKAAGLVRTRNLDGYGFPAGVSSRCGTVVGPRAVANPRPKLRSNAISSNFELGTFFARFWVCAGSGDLSFAITNSQKSWPLLLPPSAPSPLRRESMAYIRQSSPDYGFVFQVKVLETFSIVPCASKPLPSEEGKTCQVLRTFS